MWCRSRWTGITQPTDWAGTLMSLHNLFEACLYGAFFPCDSGDQGEVRDALPPVEENEDNCDTEADQFPFAGVGCGDDLDMANPEKDASFEVRQSTYRLNARTWVQSKPLGRLWGLRSVMGAQQSAQMQYFKLAGKNWDETELQRRVDGKSPHFKVVHALLGTFTGQSMIEFGILMTQPEPYEGMPCDIQTHQLACSIYRCAAAAAGATAHNVEIPSQLFP